MFCIRIGFSRTPDADAVAEVCASLAGARRGAPVALSPGPRAILPDPNPGADACGDAHWTGPGVTLHLRVAGGMAGPGVDLRGAVTPRRLADHRIVIHLQHGFEIVKLQKAKLGHGCNRSASDCRAVHG